MHTLDVRLHQHRLTLSSSVKMSADGRQHARIEAGHHQEMLCTRLESCLAVQCFYFCKLGMVRHIAQQDAYLDTSQGPRLGETAACTHMIGNGGDVCSVGWTIKGVHLQHLKVLHVHNLGCLVAAGRHKVCAVLAEAHVLDVCIVDPVLQQQFASLQATTQNKRAPPVFQMSREVSGLDYLQPGAHPHMCTMPQSRHSSWECNLHQHWELQSHVLSSSQGDSWRCEDMQRLQQQLELRLPTAALPHPGTAAATSRSGGGLCLALVA